MSSNKDNNAENNVISEQEAKIYDRQIRLWGIDAQNRMRKSRVLLYGMTGLSAEIAKNLVLAGVGSVTVMDMHMVMESQLGSQFLITQEHLGQNRALASVDALKNLNPLVKVSAVAGKTISDVDDAFLQDFDIVFLTHAPLKEQIRINELCRTKGIMFFSADTFGLYAIMFQDLMHFNYTKKIPGKADKSINAEVIYSGLKHAQEEVKWNTVRRLSKSWLGMQVLMHYMDEHGSLPSPSQEDVDKLLQTRDRLFERKEMDNSSLPDDMVATFARHARAEINPVCALFGGIAAQEVIKAISRNDAPINNYFVYDGVVTDAGFIEKIA